ncbi:hypothetical protein F503_06479 [Ophiostoma piceae UAMH 11346]|uniref:Uncharacterized protein n=1 Tax=Ophiostoma piceae (strain UAMH 11346) TaxID=1262450 RepID=S3CBZ6_OPHP1|nr:hypothetical protein F503_06479 [Ophiostoma piceae UAMH 11346]
MRSKVVWVCVTLAVPLEDEENKMHAMRQLRPINVGCMHRGHRILNTHQRRDQGDSRRWTARYQLRIGLTLIRVLGQTKPGMEPTTGRCSSTTLVILQSLAIKGPTTYQKLGTIHGAQRQGEPEGSECETANSPQQSTGISDRGFLTRLYKPIFI